MNAHRLATLRLHPVGDEQKKLQKAEGTAAQFEEVFVRTLVGSLRQTTGVGGESGGMFGSGPGADTYAGWFDERVAGQIASAGGIGIADALLEQMRQHGEIDPEAAAAELADAENRTRTPRHGGFDVVL